VDLAILGVANPRVEQAAREAGEAGAGSLVTFSSLFDEEPLEPGAPHLGERVAAIAREHGMAMLGGNGMGFVHLGSKLYATGFPTPDDLEPGGVTLISHSGSVFSAFLFNDRGIRFNLLVSSGQEIVTTMDEYLSYALDLPSTTIVGLLLETVRRPEGFVAALAKAAERGIPVFALKVGRTEGSKEMVIAHSGALAGEHGAYEAVFDAYGVHACRDLEEMADAIELFQSPRRVTTGVGIASLHDSGGERALFVDLGSDLRVPFATRGSWPTTRWTRGGPGSTPIGSTGRASRRSTMTRRRRRSRSSWTSPGRASRTKRAIYRWGATCGRRRRSRSA
jgi:acyl-CoA synthetase (NDP forming)